MPSTRLNLTLTPVRSHEFFLIDREKESIQSVLDSLIAAYSRHALEPLALIAIKNDLPLMFTLDYPPQSENPHEWVRKELNTRISSIRDRIVSILNDPYGEWSVSCFHSHAQAQDEALGIPITLQQIENDVVHSDKSIFELAKIYRIITLHKAFGGISNKDKIVNACMHYVSLRISSHPHDFSFIEDLEKIKNELSSNIPLTIEITKQLCKKLFSIKENTALSLGLRLTHSLPGHSTQEADHQGELLLKYIETFLTVNPYKQHLEFLCRLALSIQSAHYKQEALCAILIGSYQEVNKDEEYLEFFTSIVLRPEVIEKRQELDKFIKFVIFWLTKEVHLVKLDRAETLLDEIFQKESQENSTYRECKAYITRLRHPAFPVY